MQIINTLLVVPLGFAIYIVYQISHNYGISILIFAVLAKAILFPVSILAHKNSIRLLQLQPSLDRIKRRYAGDKEQLNEARYELFQKERYSPFVGLVPLFVNLFLIFGIMQVMYNPFQHIFRFDQNIIDAITLADREAFVLEGSAGEQLRIMEILRNPENLSLFQSALAGGQVSDSILYHISNTNLHFLGFNLGAVPSFAEPSLALLMPLLSGLSALVFCLVQNAISPGALSQGNGVNWGLTGFTVALSVYFASVTPLGVGLYWTAGNLLGIATTVLQYLLYNPKKLASEALKYKKQNQKSTAQLKEELRRKKELAIREKLDAKRFQSAKKSLAFYAISGGQYKYYKNIIEFILENSDTVVHYLTNDPDDGVFQLEHERLLPYYVSQSKTVFLLLKLEADIMVTTVPDLQSFHMKRSVVRDDIEYIYIPHGPASTHLTMRESAYDNFNTIFCVGPHQANEIRRREDMAGLVQKKLVKAGYGLYDQLAKSYASLCEKRVYNEETTILIAPSWQSGNIMETCIDSLLQSLTGKNYRIIIRPHPQYVYLFSDEMKIIERNYSEHNDVCFDTNFTNNEFIMSSDLLITDWSGIAFEFSYCTSRPCIFINTPMKIMNQNYKLYGMEPLDISLRDRLGVSVELDDIRTVGSITKEMLDSSDTYKEEIAQIVQRYLYYPNRNGEAGGTYIIKRLEEVGAPIETHKV